MSKETEPRKLSRRKFLEVLLSSVGAMTALSGLSREGSSALESPPFFYKEVDLRFIIKNGSSILEEIRDVVKKDPDLESTIKRKHKVSFGDSLLTVASKYKVDPEELAIVNGLSDIRSELSEGSFLFLPYPWPKEIRVFFNRLEKELSKMAGEMYGEGHAEKVPVFPMIEIVSGAAADGYFLSSNDQYPWGIYLDFSKKDEDVWGIFAHEFGHGYVGGDFNFVEGVLNPHRVVNALRWRFDWLIGNLKGENLELLVPKTLEELLVYYRREFYSELKERTYHLHPKVKQGEEIPKEDLIKLANEIFPDFENLYRLWSVGPRPNFSPFPGKENTVFKWRDDPRVLLPVPEVYWIVPGENSPLPFFGTNKGASRFIGFKGKNPVWETAVVVATSKLGDGKIGPPGSIPCFSPHDFFDPSRWLGEWTSN